MTDRNIDRLKSPTEDALGDLLKQDSQQLLTMVIEAEVDELVVECDAQGIIGKRDAYSIDICQN